MNRRNVLPDAGNGSRITRRGGHDCIITQPPPPRAPEQCMMYREHSRVVVSVEESDLHRAIYWNMESVLVSAGI